ncbi:MAG TPA: pentapeptide repeat-containing protein [Terracidiphilus sp.]|nr:pentapeptide repeat-containing protein [Terracidiphilus sp.]
MADEQEIVALEAQDSEPEIEADEGPQTEPGAKRDERADREDDAEAAGCPIRMGYGSGTPCGRKTHPAPDGVDEQPACLMHSRDPGKQSGGFFDEFRRVFEGILEEAGEGEAHFEGFVFPRLDFSVREFKAICLFTRATFKQGANFGGATFTQYADFSGATFAQNANFRGATFSRNAHFRRATFTLDADFSGATFTLDAAFREAAFTRDADFHKATFRQVAGFEGSAFMQDADFAWATFTLDANFPRATFTQVANFRRATFKQYANFPRATFTQKPAFGWATFHGLADWRDSRFLDQAEFRHTVFKPSQEGRPSAVFSFAKFAKPNEVVFDDVDLSRALFHSCDVSELWFTPSVEWGKRRGSHGLAVFEELAADGVAKEYGFQNNGQRDYRSIAQVYQQLKKNYDARLDYWTANEFHFGEMEMKRLAGPTGGSLLSVRCWLHRNLSFLNGYRIFSSYGNSYSRPAWLLLLFVLAAALAFPIPGLVSATDKCRSDKSAAGCTFRYSWGTKDTRTNNLWTEAKLIGKSAITAVDTATFQRNSEYTPAYPWGRVLAILETLLTSTLFALFLLAIRRQFKR